MHNITLVCTRHKHLGRCNSFELYQIIEKINPEIIFEELSHSNFDKSYKDKTLTTLETDAIKLYLLNHDIEHIPVDTFALPDSFEEERDYMYDRIFGVNNAESRQLRNSWEHQCALVSQHGFSYLNSDQNDKQMDEAAMLKEKVLDIINNENFFRIARMEKELIEKREDEIIRNIYNYSKEHKYEQALFFIGSGHRKSIIKKIQEFGLNGDPKLNWMFPAS